MRIRNQNECWFLLQSQLVWICLHNLLFNSIVYEKWDSESLIWKLSVNSHMGQFTSLCHMSQPHAVPSPHWTIWQMVLLVTMEAKEKMWPDQCKPNLRAGDDQKSGGPRWYAQDSLFRFAAFLAPAPNFIYKHYDCQSCPGLRHFPVLTWNDKLHPFVTVLVYVTVIKRAETLSRETSQGKQSTRAGPESSSMRDVSQNESCHADRKPTQVSQASSKGPWRHLVTIPHWAPDTRLPPPQTLLFSATLISDSPPALGGSSPSFLFFTFVSLREHPWYPLTMPLAGPTVPGTKAG